MWFSMRDPRSNTVHLSHEIYCVFDKKVASAKESNEKERKELEDENVFIMIQLWYR
jgi:hypothetical protein